MAENINLRELALDMLIEINEKGQYSHLILRDVLDKYQYISKQERAFLTRLTEGTIEHLIEIDYVIDSFSKTKVRKMKPLIRNLIRLSIYQIMYMDSVPDSAACNEAVKLSRKRGFGQLSGFVNGVLRNAARNIDKIKYPDESQKEEYLSIKYSMPRWIVEQWINDYGPAKTEEILRGFYIDKPLSIRTNTTKCTPAQLRERLESEGVSVYPVEELNYAFMISDFDYLMSLDSFNDGWFYVQDISSMMVANTCDVKEDNYVIDVCAAPGGKSTHVAEILAGTGMVEARDLTEYKVSLIEENIERHELTNMKAVMWDATVLDEKAKDKADILICDLPCSGLGVLGKKTDIRYKMSRQQEEELAALQQQILDTVYTYVKKGGTLLYSTCTIDVLENEKNVELFIKKHPEFELKSMKQMYPGEIGSDGFFIAKLIRN